LFREGDIPKLRIMSAFGDRSGHLKGGKRYKIVIGLFALTR
jgi:hypothetical protein